MENESKDESPFNRYRSDYCAKCSKRKDGNTPSDMIWKCAIVRMSLNGVKQ